MNTSIDQNYLSNQINANVSMNNKPESRRDELKAQIKPEGVKNKTQINKSSLTTYYQ
jgi:hypothetical protein